MNADATSLSDEPHDIWQLPTREEVVRSLTRGNANAGGTWVSESQKANYSCRPDKESPLWDSHAPLIYLRTSEEANNDQAWIVVYHGGAFAKPKQVGSPSHGFRAVRDPSALSEPGSYSVPKQ
ncbi:MAG: hypothetical protein KDB27_22870 [Planctomycetales bacterium]|nr:hypothetical protein [Planctomycetales bacterium]